MTTGAIRECSGYWTEKRCGTARTALRIYRATIAIRAPVCGGVAAHYPVFDVDYKRPIDLGERINICRSKRQNATPFRFESKELLALTAFVAHQSRGAAIQVTIDERLRPFLAIGRELFERRQGQLNISCAQCHDDNWGKRLAGNVIPQAQPTGYPLYRLEWQSLGSLQRRLRNCLTGMRAEAYPYGAIEYVELELYLAWCNGSMRTGFARLCQAL